MTGTVFAQEETYIKVNPYKQDVLNWRPIHINTDTNTYDGLTIGSFKKGTLLRFDMNVMTKEGKVVEHAPLKIRMFRKIRNDNRRRQLIYRDDNLINNSFLMHLDLSGFYVIQVIYEGDTKKEYKHCDKEVTFRLR